MGLKPWKQAFCDILLNLFSFFSLLAFQNQVKQMIFIESLWVFNVKMLHQSANMVKVQFLNGYPYPISDVAILKHPYSSQKCWCIFIQIWMRFPKHKAIHHNSNIYKMRGKTNRSRNTFFRLHKIVFRWPMKTSPSVWMSGLHCSQTQVILVFPTMHFKIIFPNANCWRSLGNLNSSTFTFHRSSHKVAICKVFCVQKSLNVHIIKKWDGFKVGLIFTLVLLNPDIPTFANSVDPDQLASEKPTDLYLHCLQLCEFVPKTWNK